MINELKLIDNIDILLENKIILYGAGGIGVKALKMLKEAGMPAAVYFCDGDPRKWGTFIEGVEVLSLSELKQLDESEKLAIIITSEHVPFLDQIVEDIEWLKLRTDNIFTMLGLTISLEWNNKVSGLCGGHYSTLLKMQRDISHALWIIEEIKRCASWALGEKTNPLIIYSVAKTGTSTITQSLSIRNIFHAKFHTLAGLSSSFFGQSNPFLKDMLVKYEQDFLNILKNFKSIKIISMVREPVNRYLSGIAYELRDKEGITLGKIQSDKSYVNSIAKRVENHKYRLQDWFDNELKAVFDIDVYAHPFDREKGFSIIKQRNAETLVMKLEKLNSLEQVIAEFVGTPRFKLVKNENVGGDQKFKYLYKQVKETIKIPREVFDFYYKDPRMTHFYSEEEISGFWKKWENNIAD